MFFCILPEDEESRQQNLKTQFKLNCQRDDNRIAIKITNIEHTERKSDFNDESEFGGCFDVDLWWQFGGSGGSWGWKLWIVLLQESLYYIFKFLKFVKVNDIKSRFFDYLLMLNWFFNEVI